VSYSSDPGFSHQPTPPPYGGPPPGIQLAHWGLRVVATLIDVIPAWILVTIGVIVDGPETNADGTTTGMGGIYVTCLLVGTAWVLYMSYLTGRRSGVRRPGHRRRARHRQVFHPHRGRTAVWARLPVAAVGLQKADIHRQDHGNPGNQGLERSPHLGALFDHSADQLSAGRPESACPTVVGE
jgi:hypothetical protein